jgi:hypothetical protein
MRWMTVCAGCGATLQLGDAQKGRQLQCPGCRQRVTGEPPRQPAPAPPQRRAPGRWRGWALGALAAAALVASAIGVSRLNWSGENPAAGSPTGFSTLAMPRMGKGPNLMVDMVPPGGPDERGVEGGIDVNRVPETHLTGRETEAGKGFEFVGKVPASLAAALDPATGWLLAAAPDARLHWLDPAGCRPVGSCRLDRPAYHLAVDARRRLLYAASAAAGTVELGQLGDRNRAGGDIHVYDLDSLLKGKEADASPLRRLDLDSHLTGLILSSSGDALYFTAESTHDIQVGRLDTRAWRRDKNLWLRVAGPTALALAPDRPALHALVGGRLLVLDPHTWKVLDSVAVGGSITALQAGKAGRVFLLERRHQNQVQVVDLPTRRLLGRWTLEVDGRPYLGVSADGNRLFVGTSAVASGKIWAIDASGDHLIEPAVVGLADSDRTRVLRGGLHLFGAEPYLLSGSGFVFRAGR